MKPVAQWITMVLVIVSSIPWAWADGAGVIKGTITIDGKPAVGAVVSIEGLPKDWVKAQAALVKPQKKIIDQQNLKFSPTVLAVKVGDTVEFPNHDKVWHNVYSKGGANDFDLGLYAPNNSRSKKFENAGISRILCNAHPDMEAFVVVKDHPFFSTSDSRGNYEIKNVPLGKLRVEIWYPNLGVRSEPVPLVRDGEVFDLNIDLKKR
ncbi:MAG TPA: carboxypeptidase regulatory-like domain-containing protein [Phototrophicaceae bacterium]|jgi:plastocyanin|nr:carboxypeptidase regulatory-like domain-containing protein [Phototrophicaceae bacterium]